MEEEDRLAIGEEALTAACDEYLACLFLRNADQKRYGGIRQRLARNYVLDSGNAAKASQVYPTGLVKMKRTMFDYEGKSGEPTKRCRQNTYLVHTRGIFPLGIYPTCILRNTREPMTRIYSR